MRLRQYFSPAAIASVLIIVSAESWFWLTTDSLSGSPYLEPTADIGTVMVKHEMLSGAGGKLLLAGDSSCMMGLIPETVAGSRDRSINLGTLSSFTLAGVESIVTEAVTSATPPKAVVIAVLPQTLDISEEQAEKFGLVGPYLAAYRQSSVSYTPTIADWHKWIFAKHQLGRFPEQFGGKYSVFRNTLEMTGGYYEEPGNYEGTVTPRDTVKLSDFSRRSAAAIADVCRAHDIPLIFWMSPVPADSVTENYLTASKCIAEELALMDGVQVPRIGSPAWHPALFGSVTHLTREGAELNSAELAQFLKRPATEVLSSKPDIASRGSNE